MSRNGGKVSKLESLRLSLSRARGGGGGQSSTARPGGGGGVNGAISTSPRRLSSSSSSTASPPSSCVSSEGSPDAAAEAPMVLAGCPRCMMYVMLSREDPRCPAATAPCCSTSTTISSAAHASAGEAAADLSSFLQVVS